MDALAELAGGIAHDFNNLLTAILSHACFLQEDLAEGTEARLDVDALVGAARRAEGLTRDLLVFSRRHPVEVGPVDLVGLLEARRPELERALGDHIALAIEAQPRAPRALVDPEQLAQVLAPLVANAREAMPGGGRLTLSVGQRRVDPAAARLIGVAPGRFASLRVRDTGPGIEPGLVGRIFEPFFSTRGRGRGGGLGLPTAYGLVRQAGGVLTVESVRGSGASFEVILPAALD
jgi:signal transduction histidine kinase